MSDVYVVSHFGTIIGSTRGGVNYFHSIPYSHIPAPFDNAQPLRDSQTETIDARTPRPDAVALSITAPADTPVSGAPVIVYIHGGRYESGTHEDPRAEGSVNARAGFVQVQLGYRVGLPGFAKLEGDEYFSYRGIDDCQLGLEWIQHTIEDFGGDPTNVTVVGQSAGATTALWLARRDHYRGAFRRAVVLSPCYPRDGFEGRKARLRQILKKPVTRANLTALSESELERTYKKFRNSFGYDMALGPYPLDPAELSDVPLVLSSTRDELANLGAKYPGRAIAWWLAPKFDMRRERLSTWAYLSGAGNALLGRLIGDGNIRRWTELVARCAPGKTWMIEFVRTNQPALHCQELPQLFGVENSPLNTWLHEFARTGITGFPEYRDEHAVWEFNLDSGHSRITHGALDYVAQAFAQD